MSKKADVWVSAVIYVGIAITILTIVLAAGLPVINRMRDRNTITETKDILHSLDSIITGIVRDGPGSQRTPIIRITKGDFVFEGAGISWTLPNSKFMLSQPGETIEEGNLRIITTNSPVEGEYNIQITLSYSEINIEPTIKTLSGQYKLVIKNAGVVSGKVKVTIEELGI
ncbi:hypothetical protein J4427_01855 [Candidatus Woesearchaeota archaeon]|nr:hypothetical protein [Candidatus Woesearchaeota archaeon]